MAGAVLVSALAEHGLSRLPRNRRGEAAFCMLRLNIGSENDARAGIPRHAKREAIRPRGAGGRAGDSGGRRPLRSRHSRTKDPTLANASETPTLARRGTAGKTVKDLCRKGAHERRRNAELVWADAAGMERSQSVSARRRALRNPPQNSRAASGTLARRNPH